MIIQKRTIIYSIFLFIVFLSFPANAENISSAPWDQALELLNTKEILTVSQRKKLRLLLDQVVAQKDSNEYLSRSVVERMNQKIADDRFQMQALLDTLRIISINPVAQRIGNVNTSELKDCRAKLEKLNEVIKYDSPVFIKYSERSAAINLEKEIKDKRAILLGEGAGPNFPDLWKSVRKMTLPVYPKWNKLASEFQERNNAGLNSPSGKKYLSINERRFLELFTQVQYNLRRFAQMQSDEF